MFETTRDNLRQLKAGEPGRRFRDFYEYRQQRHPGISPARILTILLGGVLVIGGVAIGWLPGPGGFIAIFGLALLAQEVRPLAALLDWLEPKLRIIWNALVTIWQRMSMVSRVAVAMMVAFTSISAGYAAYSLLR